MFLGNMASGGFQGHQSSYVALSAVTTLGLSSLLSFWLNDISAPVALLGLLSIYTASDELLFLFIYFVPATSALELGRLLFVYKSRIASARGLYLLLTFAQQAVKLVGAYYAWLLHKSNTEGEGQYLPVSSNQPPPQFGTASGLFTQDPFATNYQAPPVPAPALSDAPDLGLPPSYASFPGHPAGPGTAGEAQYSSHRIIFTGATEEG